MLTCRNFSAWIEADSNPVQEHGVVVNESAGRVTGWIPVEEGSYFTVHWSDHGGRVATCSFIFLDGGNPIPGQFLYGSGTAQRGGVRTSDHTERPFVFTNVSNAGPLPTVQSPEAGTVILKIKRVVLVGQQPPNTIEPVPTVLGNSRVGELAIGLGMELEAPPRVQTTFRVMSFENPEVAQPSTYVTFVFRYRSKAFLISQGIIATEDKVPASVSRKDQINKKKRTASNHGDTDSGPLVAEQRPKRPAKRLKINMGSVPTGKGFPDTTMPSSTAFAPALTGPPRPSEGTPIRWNMGPPPSMAESSSAGQGRFFLPAPVPAMDTTNFSPPLLYSFSAVSTVPRDNTLISARPSFAFPTVHTGNAATQHAAPVPDTDGPKYYNVAAVLESSKTNLPISSLPNDDPLEEYLYLEEAVFPPFPPNF